jgi:hypothetical protein
MQISHNSAQQNTITKLNQMADVDNAFKEAERIYKLDKKFTIKKLSVYRSFNLQKILTITSYAVKG